MAQLFLDRDVMGPLELELLRVKRAGTRVCLLTSKVPRLASGRHVEGRHESFSNGHVTRGSLIQELNN